MGDRLDDALEALANAHRRRLLVELREENPHGEVPHGSLGATVEADLAVQMVHVHLPKLEAAGYVRWDREEGVVRRGPRFGELEPLLAKFERLDAPTVED